MVPPQPANRIADKVAVSIPRGMVPMAYWLRAWLELGILSMPQGVAQEPMRTDASDLGITIMGSIVQKSLEDNVALIKEQSGSVKAVKRDHIIAEKYKVIAVYRDHIEILTRESKRYLVYSDKFSASLQAKPGAGPNLDPSGDSYSEEGFERRKGKIAMTGAYRDKLIKEDLAKVLMQATAEPHLENGQIVGFKMSQIDGDSIYAKSGVTNGDIITTINGQDLTSVAGTINLLHSLKNTDSVEIELRRGSETVKITAEVK